MRLYSYHLMKFRCLNFLSTSSLVQFVFTPMSLETQFPPFKKHNPHHTLLQKKQAHIIICVAKPASLAFSEAEATSNLSSNFSCSGFIFRFKGLRNKQLRSNTLQEQLSAFVQVLKKYLIKELFTFVNIIVCYDCLV